MDKMNQLSSPETFTRPFLEDIKAIQKDRNPGLRWRGYSVVRGVETDKPLASARTDTLFKVQSATQHKVSLPITKRTFLNRKAKQP